MESAELAIGSGLATLLAHRGRTVSGEHPLPIVGVVAGAIACVAVSGVAIAGVAVRGVAVRGVTVPAKPVLAKSALAVFLLRATGEFPRLSGCSLFSHDVRGPSASAEQVAFYCGTNPNQILQLRDIGRLVYETRDNVLNEPPTSGRSEARFNEGPS